MLHLPAPNKHHAQNNQSQSLYSLTRNSFNRTTIVTSSRISKHKTHNKNGDVTLHGLQSGFIQVSVAYPEVKVVMESSLQYDHIIVRGLDRKGVKVSRSFNLISRARAYLKSFT